MQARQQDGARRAARGAVPSVDRAVAVLAVLVEARRPMTLSELSRSLRLPKSSAHGLCQTLASHGYLRRLDNGFSIGAAVMPLADAFLRSTSIPTEFARLWSELADPPQDTVVLSLLAGRNVVYVGARNGDRPLGLAFAEGMQLPAQVAATGKALLAWQSEAAVAELLGPAFDDALRAELRRTRDRLYSVDDEGIRAGVVSFGAPVFNRGGAAVAGIGLCVHKASANDAHTRQVIDLADQMTRRLGGTFPHPQAA